MQGNILIVDGISTNRIVLKVKLTAAFYQVVQAGTVVEALEMITKHKPDLVLTAMNLPDGTAADLCTYLRKMPQTATLPVLAVASSHNPERRLATLRAGVCDVMNKPVNETLLLGRVRNMIRAHRTFAQWQLREDTNCALGLAEAPGEFIRPIAVSIIGNEAAPLQGWVRQLLPHMRASYCVTLLNEALAALNAGAPPDAIVLALPDNLSQSDTCLRLISALRASALMQDIALLVIQKTEDPLQATSALDLGADDVMTGGFEAAELAVRIDILLKRKRQLAHLLQSVHTGLQAAAYDPLTGLYNRRYAMPYLSGLIERSAATQISFAVIVADMDHFKRINDLYGHASGDAVLVETARRLRRAVRGSDMVARIGGEEFLIALPAADVITARSLAHRICDAIGGTPFIIPGAADPVHITISLGLAMSKAPFQAERGIPETPSTLLDHADKALYAAKMQGRNRVNFSLSQASPAA
ncbi:diguanylate cyclase [Sulfitobacter guttiformis]|uniref:diguanylate cyclase n=1 Tax=Sulfitobacter guttiformis TaxID=74349 RepID=A0A420DNR4_9RHOB|nr:diguanylate cyclase [Sulfitobacter guttiformis]KIN73216.1 Diguanylate cyclase response regulator [Sulfitobacter guttiformis KCTC 32187]RKE95891.1 response regulator receiver modulated diguanylate cyclase [Sulfitobacter guttiformis]